ncbi:unnamed protein product, partial [Allacma fusca]
LISFSDKNNYVNATRLFQEPKTATVYEKQEFISSPYGWKLALTNADAIVETFKRLVSTGIFSYWYQLFLKTERRYVRLWWDTRLENTTATGYLKKEKTHVPGARINLDDSNIKAINICFGFGIGLSSIVALLEIWMFFMKKTVVQVVG